MTHEALSQEINHQLDLLAEEGTEWSAGWIANAICKRHATGLATNDDARFWQYAGHLHVRREVTRAINRRAGDKPDARHDQLILPGYEHLQRYYVVERDGEEVGIPVHDCTDAELERKQSMYRAMGTACFAHAREIERYVAHRRENVRKAT